jgi:hypothetical protein
MTSAALSWSTALCALSAHKQAIPESRREPRVSSLVRARGAIQTLCRCRLLAQSCRSRMSKHWSLLGDKRTSGTHLTSTIRGFAHRIKCSISRSNHRPTDHPEGCSSSRCSRSSMPSRMKDDVVPCLVCGTVLLILSRVAWSRRNVTTTGFWLMFPPLVIKR